MGTFRRISGLCTWVFVLLATATAQQCSSSLNGNLLLAGVDSIYKVDANGNNLEVVTPNQAISLDYDYQKDILFWADLETSQIYAMIEKSSKPLLIVPKQKQWLPYSFAIDSVSAKLYVGDSSSGTVRLFDLRNYMSHAIVVGGELREVRCVDVDVNAGYLFVLDKYQILRTDLDGANRKVLLQTEKNEIGNAYRKTLSIFRILVDQEGKRLYWVDSFARQIESVDYDGEDRKVHFHDSKGLPILLSFGSLALLDGYLYWSDVEKNHVFKINVKSGKESSLIVNSAPQFLKAISCPSQKPIDNPCAKTNGECEQFCVLSKSSQENYKCACNIGYELGEDQKSCVPVGDFVLFPKDGYITGQSLSVDGKLRNDAINPSQFPVGTDAIVDYNVEAGVVYYNDLYPKSQLYQVHLDNGEETQLRPDFMSERARNLAYDWASKNLYYFTSYYADMITLNVLNVEDPSYSKILLDNVNRSVTNVVIHPHKGYVYFTMLVVGRGTTISRLATDGSDLKVIVELPEKNSIGGLAIDFEDDRLYWSQTENKLSFSLRNSNLDGSDIQDISLPNDVPGLTKLDIQGDYIYAITESKLQLLRLNKKNPSSDKVVLVSESAPGTLSSVKLFSTKAQSVNPDHPCASDKHQCAKFCFAVPNGEGGVKGVCGCPYGKKLAVNGKSCVDNSKEEPPFVPCTSIFDCKKQTA